MLVSTATTEGDDEHNESLSTRIVREVAQRKDIPIDDVDSIYNEIDPDALEDIFQPKDDGTTRTDGVVKFTFAGYEVTVTSDRTIELQLIETANE